MDCREFSNLLDAYMDGTLTETEASCMHAHAEKCADCAARLSLRRDCRKLDEEITSPESFSSGWRQMIREEEKMEKKKQKRKAWKNWAAAAAALVFVLGGTVLTRESMNRKETEKGYEALYGGALYDTGARGDNAPAALMRNASPTADYAMTDAAMYASEEVAEKSAAEKIIRTASFTIKTLEYDHDLEKIQQLTEEMGGRVEYLSANGEKNTAANRYARLTLRIPSEKLDVFLAGAQGIGSLTALTQESKDVSESYYDTQSRLETQQEKMERLQALLTEAENVSDLIEIETAIADTQYWIDHYMGQLNHYDAQINYSTVSVYLQEIKIAESEKVTFWQRIASGLQDSWAYGTEMLGDMTIFLIAVAPWGIAVGIIVFVIRKIRKKRKEK